MPLPYHYLSHSLGIHFDFVPSFKYAPKAGHHHASFGIVIHLDWPLCISQSDKTWALLRTGRQNARR